VLHEKIPNSGLYSNVLFSADHHMAICTPGKLFENHGSQDGYMAGKNGQLTAFSLYSSYCICTKNKAEPFGYSRHHALLYRAGRD
jgi:hypothetical protein